MTPSSHLAGYCIEVTAWRILRDISLELTNDALRHHATITPQRVVADDSGAFTLADSTTGATNEAYLPPEGPVQTDAAHVWSLAAVVFNAVMGRQVMNGKGGRGQTAQSRIPYMRSTMPELSELVQRCLHHDPRQRPTLQQLHTTAATHYDRCQDAIRQGPPPHPHSAPTSNLKRQASNSLAFWPEDITAQPR